MHSTITPGQPMDLWAFLENSDFQRLKGGKLYRQDEVKLIRHDEFLETDYQLMVDIGCVGVRDAARWYISHPAPGVFDWTWLDQMVGSAEKYGFKLYLDLWHYGYPDWLDLMADDAPAHFAEFAEQIARRYPSLIYYCISNEPSLMVENAGRRALWRPFLHGSEAARQVRRQICKMIIRASEAVLAVKPDAILVLPDPWHASHRVPEARQAAVIDTVLGRHDPELGGRSELITIVGLNHYRDSGIPPFHQMIMRAQERWPDKLLWLTETSGGPKSRQQVEWFWSIMAELQLAKLNGVDIPVFTWAPAIAMYDWVHEKRKVVNGIWRIDSDGQRVPNGLMLEAIRLAREYGYLH